MTDAPRPPRSGWLGLDPPPVSARRASLAIVAAAIAGDAEGSAKLIVGHPKDGLRDLVGNVALWAAILIGEDRRADTLKKIQLALAMVYAEETEGQP